MKEVSIIIPTYNEVKNLPFLLEELHNSIDYSQIDVEFIIVDDNSPDKTGDIAEELTKKYPLKVIHRAGKLGLGSAVIEGFKKSNRLFLGVMDADLSHDPAIINKMILSLDNCDIAIGSRFVSGSRIENFTLDRRIIAKTGIFLARVLTGVKDPSSGYFFIKRKVIDSINLKTIGYKILLEILVKGNYNKIEEFPYTFRMRKYSHSKLNIKEYMLFAKQIIEYSFYKLWHNLFYGQGN